MRVERIEREIVQRGEQPEGLRPDPVNEGAAPAADRAVADADVIEVGVDLEPDAAAMA
jgi:hypothetical protein